MLDVDPFNKKVKDCKCCHGRGVQLNHNTGMNQKCPCCNGTGKERKEENFLRDYRIDSR